MKLVVLYHPNSEMGTPIETFIEEIKGVTDKEIDLLSLETKEGADYSKLYGVTQYPAILVLRDDGQLNKSWEGNPLPAKDDVTGYLNT